MFRRWHSKVLLIVLALHENTVGKVGIGFARASPPSWSQVSRAFGHNLVIRILGHNMKIRTDTLKTLALRLNPVVSKRLGVVLCVQGGAGLGKTWVLSQLLPELKCRSQTLPATASTAQWLKSLARPKKVSASSEKALARVEAGEMLEDSLVLKVLSELLRELAPFVLHLEDVHDASQERLELLAGLQAVVLKTKGVGLILTSRHELPFAAGQVLLEPLSREESDVLLLTELGAAIPFEALDYIFARARGNPLFSLEFLRFLTRLGSLWSDGKIWNWRAPTTGFVPVTIEALLENLLMTASNDVASRAVLEALAFLKTPPKDLWRLVAGLTQTEFEAAISTLEAQQILRNAAFVHPLYQEVMAGLLTNEQKQNRSRYLLVATSPDLRAAWVLLEELTALVLTAKLSSLEEQRWLEQVCLVAEQSGQHRFASRCKAWLAERSDADIDAFYAIAEEVGIFDPTESMRLMRLILGRQPDHLKAGTTLSNLLCDRDEFIEAQLVLDALPEKLHSDLTWLGMKIVFLCKSGQFQELISFYELHPEIMTIPASYYVAFAYYILGQDDQARAIAATRAEHPIENFEKSALFSIESGVLLRQGRFLEALEFADKHVELARGLNEPIDLATALRSRSQLFPRLLREQESYADLREALELSLEIGDTRNVLGCQVSLCRDYLDSMQYQKTETLLLEIDALQSQLPKNEKLFYTKLNLSELYDKWQPAHGKALAQKYVRAALSLSESLQHKRLRLLALCRAAMVEARLGQAAQALKYAEEAWQVLTDRNSPPEERVQCLQALASAFEVNIQPKIALEKLREAEELSQKHGFERLLHSSKLEMARLENDSAAAKQELLWFETHGTAYMVHLTKQYFPELEVQAKPVTDSQSPQVFLNVLGSVQLVKDGKSIYYRGRKRLDFLLILLEARISGQTEVSTLGLIDALYPDFMEIEGKAALKQLVYQLRNSLGSNVIQSTAKGYMLGGIVSDAEQFLQTRDTAYWRGVYMADLPGVEQSNLRNRLVSAVQSQLEILIETDTLETARLGQIVLEMEPYDRDALELTLRALKQAGQSTQTVYQNAKERFVELGEKLPNSSDAFLALSLQSRLLEA